MLIPSPILRRLLVVTAGFIVVLTFPSRGLAQTYTCASETSEAATSLRDYVVRLVTATDPTLVATRQKYNLPAASAASVTIVTNKRTCTSAAQAYESALNVAGTTPVSRSMVVIQIGTTRYVMLDPKERNGEYEVNMVTDQNFNVLAMFAS